MIFQGAVYLKTIVSYSYSEHLVNCDFRAFFRRSVDKCSIYYCINDKDCIVNKWNRNDCPYCRLKKCLWSGMRTNWVSTKRQKNTDQKATKSIESIDKDVNVPPTKGMFLFL